MERKHFQIHEGDYKFFLSSLESLLVGGGSDTLSVVTSSPGRGGAYGI